MNIGVVIGSSSIFTATVSIHAQYPTTNYNSTRRFSELLDNEHLGLNLKIIRVHQKAEVGGQVLRKRLWNRNV